jgi:hypothetical protein
LFIKSYFQQLLKIYIIVYKVVFQQLVENIGNQLLSLVSKYCSNILTIVGNYYR